MSTRTLPFAILATLALAAPGCDRDPTIPVVTDGDELGDGEEAEEGHEEEEEEEEDEFIEDMVPPSDPPTDAPEAVKTCADTEGGFDSEKYRRECITADREEGESFCVVIDGEELWTECSVAHECEPWDTAVGICGFATCHWDGELLRLYTWEDRWCDTPLVVALDDRPLGFEPAGAAAFDISGVGECLSTDWPTHPWLALDRDGDGVISSGRELFGSGTVLAAGGRAEHGFAALAELDADGDGKITAADPAFAELVLWSDHDGDRQGTWSELVPVMAVDLVAIHLDYEHRVECDDRGNCGAQRAAFEYKDALGARRSGEIVDVYLACQ